MIRLTISQLNLLKLLKLLQPTFNRDCAGEEDQGDEKRGDRKPQLM